MRSIICALSTLVLISSHAVAQSPTAGPPPGVKRVAGTVQSVSEGKLTIVSENGETIEVTVPAGVPLAREVEASRAELAAAKLANCNSAGVSGEVLQATRCGIIPADTKMVNRGYFPGPSGTARTVGDVASVKGDPAKDLELVITYKDGQQRIAVPVSAKVTKSAPMEMREIKPGDEVVGATRVIDGKTSVIAMGVTQKK